MGGFLRNLLGSALAAVVIGGAGGAVAATCSETGHGIIDNYAYGIDSFTNSGCQIGSQNGDDLSGEMTVNSDLLFDHGDWIYLRRLDSSGADLGVQGSSVAFTYSPAVSVDGLFGNFTVADDFFDTYSAFMIVIKGAETNTWPGQYVAFVFTEFDGLEGLIAAPFLRGTDSAHQPATQFTLYGLTAPFVPPSSGGGTGVVPLPAAGWVMLGGLGSLAAVRRRRKAA